MVIAVRVRKPVISGVIGMGVMRLVKACVVYGVRNAIHTHEEHKYDQKLQNPVTHRGSIHKVRMRIQLQFTDLDGLECPSNGRWDQTALPGNGVNRVADSEMHALDRDSLLFLRNPDDAKLPGAIVRITPLIRILFYFQRCDFNFLNKPLLQDGREPDRKFALRQSYRHLARCVFSN